MWKNDGLLILITAVSKSIDFAQNFISFAVQTHQNFIVGWAMEKYAKDAVQMLWRDLLRRWPGKCKIRAKTRWGEMLNAGRQSVKHDDKSDI